MTAAHVVVQAEGVRVFRDGQPVCHDISLDLEAGQCLGLVGPNGSGKSTLLLGLRGLLATTGKIRLDGIDPATSSRHTMARHVAVMPQRMEFAVPYSVGEMVLLGRTPHRRPWEPYSRNDRERVASLLERVGLLHRASDSVEALSGGERRKVFLARALAQETPVLFLDEPLAGLDPAAQAELARFIADLREQGKAILAVFHDVRIAAGLCHTVLGLGAGRPRFRGAPGDVLDEKTLQELYGVEWSRYSDAGGKHALLPAFEDGRGGE